MKNFLLTLFAFNFLLLSILAQSGSPASLPTAKDNDVVRVTTNLIRIDVTAADKNGKQVTDLKPEEFEIYENNEKQEITNFSYVEVKPSVSVEKTKSVSKKDNGNEDFRKDIFAVGTLGAVNYIVRGMH